MHNSVIAWILSIMVQVAPPDRLAAGPQWPGWEETAEQKLERYESFAEDLYEVVYDPAFKPLYDGRLGRARTATLVLGVAFHESGFAHDTDKGPCYRGPGNVGRCDGGASACVMQVNVGAGTSQEGWTRAELFAERTKCFRAGIRLLRRSMRACSKLEGKHWLAAYAAGTCEHRMGQQRSMELLALGERFAGMTKIPGPDTAFLVSRDSDTGHRGTISPVP
jgi:hypothetical protein